MYGIPSLEDLLKSYGWQMTNEKLRHWFNPGFGNLEEEDAITALYIQIADLESIGVKLEKGQYVKR